MKNIKKIAKFLRKSNFYDKACVLFEVPDDIKKIVCNIANSIPKEKINIDAGGIDDQSHVTVLYGVNDDIDLQKYFSEPLRVRTDDKVTYFDNDSFSVAKIKVFCNDLEKIHHTMKESEPNEHKYDYSPHITIAYLNKGERLDNDNISKSEWQQNHVALQRNGLINKHVLQSN